MNPLEEALGLLVEFLEREKIPYMVIGGIAGLAWGVRRATFDVDVTIWAPERTEPVRRLCAVFKSRVSEPERFVADTGVLPLVVAGTNADVVFGDLPYESSAIRRAKPVRLGSCRIRVCTPEDLIVHKIISERPKDLADVREIVSCRASELDRAYLDPLVKGLSQDLGRPAIWDHYADCLASRQLRADGPRSP